MLSKLLASRLAPPVMGKDKDAIHTAARHSPDTSSSQANPALGQKVPAEASKPIVPLDTLASVVSMELGDQKTAPSLRPQGASNTLTPFASASAGALKSSLFDLGRISEQKAGLGQTGAQSAGMPMTGLSGTNTLDAQSALLAARMAEEQDALSFYLKQRQKSSVELQLEHLRRVQAASLLYGPGLHHLTPTASSLHHLDTILAARQARLGAASDLAKAQHLLRVQQHLGGGAPRPNAITSLSGGSVTTASATGASDELSGSSKRPAVEAVQSNKPIKERPEEYRHLSKKARNTPLQRAVATEFGASSSKGKSIRATDLDADEDMDEEKSGHRFRPYQFEQWTEKFQELCDFRKERGHCQVPHTYKDNPPLARWVKRQRYQYKLKAENKMSTMTDQRAKLLEDIGFIWDSHAAAWAEKLHELKDYAAARGDCNVPSTYPENPQLATWVKCQRRQYKLLRDNKTSNMTVDRIVELEKLGFVWEVRKSFERDSRKRPAATAT